jgi:DNA-binding NtrC family response regulator
MLECCEYNVLIAHTGESALRMAERDDLAIDLMLIDVLMPKITGPDLAERIQAIRPHQKVLFMSACTESEVVRVKIIDRSLAFLAKPFSSDTLLQKVQNTLGFPGMLRNPNEDDGTPGEGCAGVTAPLLPRRPLRPPMAVKLPLPE